LGGLAQALESAIEFCRFERALRKIRRPFFRGALQAGIHWPDSEWQLVFG
jgi:hypothetical protein